MSEQVKRDILQHTAAIVAARLSHKDCSLDEIPQWIKTVYDALVSTSGLHPLFASPQNPAVPIKKSVQPDYIICLEDGKKLKMLRRHLKTVYKMTPAQYREKWNLPQDYPMVAPNYARQRSKLAKDIGLGTKSTRMRKTA